MSPGKHSPRLASTILKQAGRHTAVREPSPELVVRASSGDDDAIFVQSHFNFITRVQMDAITDRFRDHNLPLLPNLACHTGEV